MYDYCKITINEVIKLDCRGESSLGLKKNDWCIVKRDSCLDYGRVVYIGEMPKGTVQSDLKVIKRRATLVDQGKAHENTVRSKSFHRTALEKMKEYKLPMRLVATHFVFDRSLVSFVFTSPSRVDYRELIRDLNNTLNLKIEFKQLGLRDYAGMIGGVDTCGRTLCCSTFLTNFVSINMKMAKDQGISLNPSNIIGACGRLKCCLSYEHEGYKLLLKSMPKVGSKCTCQGCDGRIIEGNPLTQTVKVALDNSDKVVSVPVSELSS